MAMLPEIPIPFLGLSSTTELGFALKYPKYGIHEYHVKTYVQPDGHPNVVRDEFSDLTSETLCTSEHDIDNDSRLIQYLNSIHT
jgi:hypothetical protein